LVSTLSKLIDQTIFVFVITHGALVSIASKSLFLACTSAIDDQIDVVAFCVETINPVGSPQVIDCLQTQ